MVHNVECEDCGIEYRIAPAEVYVPALEATRGHLYNGDWIDFRCYCGTDLSFNLLSLEGLAL